MPNLKERPTALQIRNDAGEIVVSAYYDGTVECAPGIDLDEAARDFWEAIAKHSPSLMRP